MTKQALNPMLILYIPFFWFGTLVARDNVGDLNKAAPFSQDLFHLITTFVYFNEHGMDSLYIF
jgi:hypothetical protein